MPSATRTRPRAGASAPWARPSCLPRPASSPTATPARWPRRRTVPRSGSCGPRGRREGSSTSTPTRPAPSSRERASPPGSSTGTAFRHHPHRRDGRLAHGPRGDLLRGRRRGPHRRQRRRGQQDRHLRPRRAGPPPRHPFYVAAPWSTFDPSLPTGAGIPSRSATPTRWCASSAASSRRKACRPATRPSTSRPPPWSRPSCASGACSGPPTAGHPGARRLGSPGVPTDGTPRHRITACPARGARSSPSASATRRCATSTTRFSPPPGPVLRHRPRRLPRREPALRGGYLAIGDGIEEARPGSFADAFFFSVQTMATIGYGKMAPRGLVANLLVTVEALIGLLGWRSSRASSSPSSPAPPPA